MKRWKNVEVQIALENHESIDEQTLKDIITTKQHHFEKKKVLKEHKRLKFNVVTLKYIRKNYSLVKHFYLANTTLYLISHDCKLFRIYLSNNNCRLFTFSRFFKLQTFNFKTLFKIFLLTKTSFHSDLILNLICCNMVAISPHQ